MWAGRGYGLTPFVMAGAALGAALVALGVAALVPPWRGYDAVPAAFRYATAPCVLPGVVLTCWSVFAFRRAWRAAERDGPPRREVARRFVRDVHESMLGQGGWMLWRPTAIYMSGVLQATIAGLGVLFGLVVIGLGFSGGAAEGPGVILLAAAVAVASAWLLVNGWRRIQRRLIVFGCMEARRSPASVRLHRSLEVLLVGGLAAGWLVSGQAILVFDVAG